MTQQDPHRRSRTAQVLYNVIFCGDLALSALKSLRFSGLKLSKPILSAPGRVLIIGNGPSMVQDWAGHHKNVYDTIVCVNDFYKLGMFAAVQPTHYLLQDSFWFDEAPTNERALALVEFLRKEKISSLSCIIPRRRKTSWLRNELEKLPNVSVLLTDSKSLPVGPFEFASQFLPWTRALVIRSWDLGLTTVFPHNSNGTCLYEAIRGGAKSVDLIGIEMSMADAIHANNAGVPKASLGSVARSPANLPGKAGSFAKAYQSVSDKFFLFELLAIFAKKKGILVRNLSRTSRLDMFPKTNGDRLP